MHFSRSEKRTIIITCSNNSQRPKDIIDGNPNKSGTDRIMSKPKESKLMKIAKTWLQLNTRYCKIKLEKVSKFVYLRATIAAKSKKKSKWANEKKKKGNVHVCKKKWRYTYIYIMYRKSKIYIIIKSAKRYNKAIELEDLHSVYHNCLYCKRINTIN